MPTVKINRSALNSKLQNIRREQINRINRNGVLNNVLRNLKADIRKGINPKTGRNYRRLQSSTIKNRRRLSRSNSTSSSYAPTKSNVTLTGELVDSLKSTITRFRNGLRITIRATGRHAGYRNLNGSRGKSVLNSTIINALEEKGFPILRISRGRLSQIRTNIINRLRRN